MKCINCSLELSPHGSEAVACPRCGTVNKDHSKPHKVGKLVVANVHGHTEGWRGRILKRRQALVVLAAVVSVIVLGSALAVATTMHHHARPHHAGTAIAIHVAKPPVEQQVSTPTPTPTPTPTAKPAPTPAAVQAPAPQSTLDQTVTEINQSLSSYGVVVTLSPPNNSYTFSTWSTLTDADTGYLQQFKDYLMQEFEKYPHDLVRNSGLRTIGLVKDLHVSGQARAAVPAPNLTEMIYDVDLMTVSGSEYAREVVSHEYWHYLDYKTHGDYYYADPQWSACNPSGFIYGNGGWSAYDPSSGYVAAFHPSEDFITAYSKYGIEEDRAEMFGWLMYDPARVKNLADPGINCKINRLTTLVHQLSPTMSF